MAQAEDDVLLMRGMFHNFLMTEDMNRVDRIEIVIDCRYEVGPCGYMSTNCDRFTIKGFFDHIGEEQYLLKEFLTEELPFVDIFFLVDSDFLIPVESAPVHTGWHSLK
ncbi:MAG: hypothetical protein LBV63_03710 [Candidatus Methanoplasma sp.]|nr:hypothetical protein [Candidatus Methanoplasma sp.]